MSATRSRLNLVFKPTPEERNVPMLLRARFAMMGAHSLTPLTPETEPELYAMLEQVSEKSAMPTPLAYVWDTDKPAANAVAVPSKPPIVAFSRSITELLTTEELGAVAAHELGHVKNMGHSGKIYWLSAIGGMFAADFVARPFQRAISTAIQNGNTNPLLPTANAAITAGRFIAPVAAGAIASRSEELSADRHGAMTMGDATPLISALEKLTQHNHGAKKSGADQLKDTLLKPFTVLTRSHPTFEKRQDALGVTSEGLAQYRAAHGDTTHVNALDETPKQPAASWQSRVGTQQQREAMPPQLER